MSTRQDLEVWQADDRTRERLDNWIDAAAGAHDEFSFTANDVVATAVAPADPADWKVALLTTGGLHVKDQPPFDVLSRTGDPTVREIPSDTPRAAFAISDTHYDHSAADHDVNVLFPIDRLRELAAEGVIGGISPIHFGLMGFAPNPRRDGFIELYRQVAQRLNEEGVNVAVLTPG